MNEPRVAMMYHPSLHVADLDTAEDWYRSAFGRPSTRLSTLSKRPARPGFSDDYCTFTPIADVLLDTIDPTRYLVDGHHLYEPVAAPMLRGIGWYANDAVALFRRLRDAGVTVVDQMGQVAEGDDPPTSAGTPMPLFFTLPSETGIRHEFLPRIPFPLDHRLSDGWEPGAVDPGVPLGIVRCTHHSVRSSAPQRGVEFLRDVLGGEVIHEGHDELLGAEATYVALADSIIQVVADPATGPESDDYFSIAWLVADLAAARTHLESAGVVVAATTGDGFITDPATSLGVAWRFGERPVPGDPRRASGSTA